MFLALPSIACIEAPLLTPEELFHAYVVSHGNCGLETVKKLARIPTDKLYSAALSRVPAAMVLKTCNRVEVYWSSASTAGVEEALRRVFREEAGVDPGSCASVLRGLNAAKHLLEVAAGLDSMMIGENEILGQVRQAYKEALRRGALDKYLDLLARRAIHAGRRVRAETGISRGATSIPLAAVRLAERALGGLGGKRILVVGAGKAASIIASAIVRRSPGDLVILNRTRRRAVSLAHKLGVRAGGLEDLDSELGRSDVVFVAVAGTSSLIDIKGIGEKPRLIVDVSMPPAVEADGDPRVVWIDSLRREAEENAARRAAEAEKAWRIVEEELRLLARLAEKMTAEAVISQLMREAEAVRMREVERAFKALEARGVKVDGSMRPIIEAMSHSITRKVLRPIYEALRKAVEEGGQDEAEFLLRLVRGGLRRASQN